MEFEFEDGGGVICFSDSEFGDPTPLHIVTTEERGIQFDTSGKPRYPLPIEPYKKKVGLDVSNPQADLHAIGMVCQGNLMDSNGNLLLAPSLLDFFEGQRVEIMIWRCPCEQ